jgi:hypothetical protein
MKIRTKTIRRTNHIDGGVVWNSINTEFYLASKLKCNFTALMSFTVDGVFSLVHKLSVDIEQVILCGKLMYF